MIKAFNTTPHRAVKTISSTPSPRAIPSTSARKPSADKPAPLSNGKARGASRCASCGGRGRF